jgi:hypothetical protein
VQRDSIVAFGDRTRVLIRPHHDGSSRTTASSKSVAELALPAGQTPVCDAHARHLHTRCWVLKPRSRSRPIKLSDSTSAAARHMHIAHDMARTRPGADLEVRGSGQPGIGKGGWPGGVYRAGLAGPWAPCRRPQAACPGPSVPAPAGRLRLTLAT